MTKSIEREIESLRLLVRELQAQVDQLKSQRGHVVRPFAEVCLAAPETGDTIPDAIANVSSGTQVVDDGVASVLELVNDSGTIKLKPIQNAAGGDKAKVTYLNAAKSQPTVWTTGNEPMLLVRLRDGRWIRFPAGGGGGSDIEVVTGIRVNGNYVEYKKRTIKAVTVGSESAWTAFIEFACPTVP